MTLREIVKYIGEVSISRSVASSLLGAALLGVPAAFYRITRLECTANFSSYQHLLACGCYLLAVALMTVGWVGMLRRTDVDRPQPQPPTLRAVLGLGALVQLVSLLGLPFLSRDPLFYASLGRAAVRFGGTPYTRLCDSLPPDDPFLRLLPEVWRCGTSAYGSGFNRLTVLLAQLAPDDLDLQLRLYQLVGLGALVLTAGLAGLAARANSNSTTAGDRGPWAAALVLFSPLAVIEGTLSAHNDVFLGLAAAGFVFLLTRRRPVWAGLVLVGGLLIKLSAVLLAGFYLTTAVLRGVRRSRWLAVALLAVAFLGVTAVSSLFGPRFYWAFYTPAHAALELIGNPTSSAGHCTRSVECLPRSFLIWIAHAKTAAWLVGVGFRMFGGLFLLYTAVRAARDGATLRWAAIFFFFYYLFLHGYMQSWYFLPLLPLIPYLPVRLRRVALVQCVCAVCYYVLYIPVYCAFSPQTAVLVTLSEVGQAAVAIIPATVVLLRRPRQEPGRQIG